jgi:Ca-activated chloride channel family protein
MHMALGVKKGSVLFAILLIGTFGLHAVYRAQAKSPTGTLVDGLALAPARALASDGKVQLTASVDRRAVLQKGDGLVHVEVTVAADALPDATQRTPADVVVVMDRSGSMAGQKLEYAKLALLGLIERLGPADRLGVVIFDGAAEVLFPLESPGGSQREKWNALVRAVETAGGTNIRDGLDVGFRMIASQTTERVSRILLLSDGQDTAGNSFSMLVDRARAIGSKQAVLSTLGIGQDFDEHVMTALASAGTGAFYYLAKLEVLAGILDAELKTATETYASGAELRLRVGDGVQVMSAGGLSLETRGSEVAVAVGSLYAGRERKIWLSLKLPTDVPSERGLGTLALRYSRSGQSFDVAGAALPVVECVANQDHFEKSIDPAVWGRAMLEEELTRAREELGDAIARGTATDVDTSVARVEAQRALAEKLGQTAVAQEMTELKSHGARAKMAQQAAPEARNAAAKREKAMGYGKRNSSSYGGTDFAFGF